MATNLLILYPDIPFRSTITSDRLTTGSDAAYGVTGARAQIVWEAAAGTTLSTIYDLGAGVTALPNVVAVAGLNQLLAAAARDSVTTAQVGVYGDDNDAFSSADTDTADVTTASLVGPEALDYVRFVTFETAYRYWRVSLGAAGITQRLSYSKIFLGSYFDMGRDPVHASEFEIRRAGRQYFAAPERNIGLEWQEITDANKTAFMNLAQQRDLMTFFLYDQGDALFDGDKLLYCSLIDATYQTSGRNRWNISATFRVEP